MGFFSEKSAEEYSVIEIDMYLETTDCEVILRATIMECRVSADSENPGNWLRVRFEKGQEKEADVILAHVTNRQIEKLKRQERLDPNLNSSFYRLINHCSWDIHYCCTASYEMLHNA